MIRITPTSRQGAVFVRGRDAEAPNLFNVGLGVQASLFFSNHSADFFSGLVREEFTVFFFG
jgi:hypothetical protein